MEIILPIIMLLGAVGLFLFRATKNPSSVMAVDFTGGLSLLYEATLKSDGSNVALDPDQALAEIPVKYSSETDTLLLYPDDQMMTILPSSSDNTVTQKFFHLPEAAAAPIKQGDVIGTVEIMRLAQYEIARSRQPMATYLAVALVYFVCTYLTTLILRKVERRLAIPDIS